MRSSAEFFAVPETAKAADHADAANALPGEDLVDSTGFGKYQATLTTPRVMQFSLRFAF